MSDLRETYFGTEEERSEQEREARDAIRSLWRRQAEFVLCEYVKVDLHEWFKTQLELCEPAIGPHEEMLFNAGVRSGLKRVVDHIRDIERRMENIDV